MDVATPPDETSTPSSAAGPSQPQGVEDAAAEPVRDERYPLTVLYCSVCGLPAELHEFHSRSQFEKCSGWLRKNAPQYFPELFPDECAARLEALKLAEQTGVSPPLLPCEEPQSDAPKVAVPIEQKTSGGKKKKTPAHIILALGQRKGKKQVTIVYGLDLFGIKLKDAAKAAKRKFATGSSITMSPDNREVIEIQGSRQQDFAQLVHEAWGVRSFLSSHRLKSVYSHLVCC
ncbi:Translation initiation factor SUI1 [Gracilaria domingensis]|nr:Translation initiation factor SUI1 [Gracilaria domingensis]